MAKRLKAPLNDLRERVNADGAELSFNNWRDVKLPEFLLRALALSEESPDQSVYAKLREVAET